MTHSSTPSRLPFGAPARVLERAELAANEIRRSLGTTGPISAFEVAERLGFEVELGRHMRPRGMTIPGEPKIWLKSGELGVRMQHAGLHEIAHHHVYDQRAEPKLLEKACDVFAVCVAMPRHEFAASARAATYNPRALQRIWRFSSLEAIARRIGETCPEVVTAAWVALAPKWFEATATTGDLAKLEREALGLACLKGRGVAEVRSEHGTAWAWRTGSGTSHALSVCRAA